MTDIMSALMAQGGPVAVNTETTPEQQRVKKVIDSMTGKDKEELLAKFNQWFKKCRQDRIPFEREWYLNMAFYFGKQYVTWVNTNVNSEVGSQYSRLIEPKAPAWRVRLVVNRIKPIIRKELAKLNQERPRGFVVPSSSDDDDLAAAKAANAIYEWLTEQEIGLQDIFWRADFWACLTGTGFIKDWYAENETDRAGVIGAIRAEPVSPFHLLVPNLEEPEIEKQPYVIHCMTKEVKDVEAVYDVKLTPDVGGSDSGIESQFLSALGLTNTNERKQVVVKEIWVKPCKDYPNGLWASWANEQLLFVNEGNPWEHGEYPFTKIEHIPTGRFYAQSSIVDLIPLQKEYNRTRSQIIEAKNRMSKPQLTAPKGSIDPRKVTSEPGLIVFYQPGMQPPAPLPLQPLPNYVLQELDRSILDMSDLSSQHEVSRGQVPPNVEAATAIAYLQEQDDTALAHTIRSIESAHEKIGRHLLSLAGQFWDAQRTIRVVGRNGVFESYVFSKSDLRGATDFRVVHGSATPRSRAAKQAQILEFIKLGLIPPDRGLNFLEYAETDRLYEEMQIDYRHAQRENLKMQQGEQVPVNIWDNHVAHITEHMNYEKRQEFENLPAELQQAHIIHNEMHKAQLAAEMGVMLPPFSPFLNGFIKQVLGQTPALPGMMPTSSDEPQQQDGSGGAEQPTQ